jgi:transposase
VLPLVRAELRSSTEGTRALAAHYGLTPKTVAKWRRRTGTADVAMGSRRPRSSVLTEAEEAIVVEFRRRTLLPLDDVLGCLRETSPNLSRVALHRRLVRHGISRLPRDEEKASKRWRLAETAIGYVHIEVCEMRLAECKLFILLATCDAWNKDPSLVMINPHDFIPGPNGQQSFGSIEHGVAPSKTSGRRPNAPSFAAW